MDARSRPPAFRQFTLPPAAFATQTATFPSFFDFHQRAASVGFFLSIAGATVALPSTLLLSFSVSLGPEKTGALSVLTIFLPCPRQKGAGT